MSNLYTTTARIHELLPKINQKFGLEIEVIDISISPDGQHLWFKENCYYFNNDSFDIEKHCENVRNGFIPAIQAPQIRQILVGLQEVLGKNPEYNKLKKDTFVAKENIEYFNKLIPKSKSETLCQHWLDGLEPLIEREPEMVLTELVEILENLLK